MESVRPITVLLVNKFFYPRAGAETAFFHVRDLLKERGHRVLDFGMQDPRNVPSDQAPYFAPARSYDNGGRVGRRLLDAGSSVYSRSARKAIGALLDRERPDVAHLHNVYHQLTLSIVDELHERGIPIVQTLHDYKIACPAYTLFTEGKPCRRCVESSLVNVIRHRCIKGSVSASAMAAVEAGVARRRGTYDRIQRYMAPSRFAASVALAAGIPAERVHHVPYFLPDEELDLNVLERHRDPVFFFGGRLEETKGVLQLLSAFDQIPAPARLRIAGWGSLEHKVAAAARSSDRIEFLGTLTREQVLAELACSRALVLPSLWEDNSPFMVLEAQARATPVIASNRGGPPEFVRNLVEGLVVDPDDVDGLAARMRMLALDKDLATTLGRNGRSRLLAEHRATVHYDRLTAVYEMARTDCRPE